MAADGDDRAGVVEDLAASRVGVRRPQMVAGWHLVRRQRQQMSVVVVRLDAQGLTERRHSACTALVEAKAARLTAKAVKQQPMATFAEC